MFGGSDEDQLDDVVGFNTHQSVDGSGFNIVKRKKEVRGSNKRTEANTRRTDERDPGRKKEPCRRSKCHTSYIK